MDLIALHTHTRTFIDMSFRHWLPKKENSKRVPQYTDFNYDKTLQNFDQ